MIAYAALVSQCLYPVDLEAVRDSAQCLGQVLKQDAEAVRWQVEQPALRPFARRLRVGMLSSDLRKHVVAFFLESVPQAMHANGVDLIACANHEPREKASPNIRAGFARWRRSQVRCCICKACAWASQRESRACVSDCAWRASI